MSGLERRSTPAWVWVIVVGLACLQPAAHLVCAYIPPEGMVPTGLHIGDSALFIQAMDMLQTGFHSPYATVFSEHGANHWTHFSIPHLWFYAIQGQIADSLGVDHFLFYGFFNGVAAALFLWAMYRFFVAAAPDLANRAFVLFSLGGGLGGLIWLATGVVGLHDSAQFEDYMWRFAIYELVEGAHLFPATYYARSYYTISLAGCFGALTVFIHAFQIRCPRHAVLAGIVLLPAAFLNARYGVFVMSIGFLIFVQRRGGFAPVRYLVTLMVMGLVGVVCSYLLMRTGPAMLRNHVDVGDMHMHFSPFIASTILILPFALLGVFRLRGSDNVFFRVALYSGLGYLAAHTILFCLYQVYMGNVLIARDSAVAVVVSDWALVGGLIGAVMGYRAAGNRPSAETWIAVWFLGFVCLAISAFGQGWFLEFGPQRLTPLVFIAMCLVAAGYISRRQIGVVAVLGTVSIFVSTFVFQSSLGWRGAEGAFASTHYSVMNEVDEKMLDALRAMKPNRVIAHGPIADVIALHHIASVFHGVGSFNMSDEPYGTTRALQELFFDPTLYKRKREIIVQGFGVDYVVLSATWPVDRALVQALDSDPLFTTVYREDGAWIFSAPRRNDLMMQDAEAVLEEVGR